MGIAKTMSLLSSSNLYCSNPNEFAQKLSTLFSVNVKLLYTNFTSDFERIDKEEEHINNNYSETYTLHVSTYDYECKFPAKESEYNMYEFTIPVNLVYDQEYDLVFLPNNIIQLEYLSFNGAWHFFINDISGKSDTAEFPHKLKLAHILEIRNCYINILKKIDCHKVLLWTDAHYKTENKYVFDLMPGITNTLDDVLADLKPLDDITLYNFKHSLETKEQFKNVNSDLKIAFLDTF